MGQKGARRRPPYEEVPRSSFPPSSTPLRPLHVLYCLQGFLGFPLDDTKLAPAPSLFLCPTPSFLSPKPWSQPVARPPPTVASNRFSPHPAASPSGPLAPAGARATRSARTSSPLPAVAPTSRSRRSSLGLSQPSNAVRAPPPAAPPLPPPPPPPRQTPPRARLLTPAASPWASPSLRSIRYVTDYPSVTRENSSATYPLQPPSSPSSRAGPTPRRRPLRDRRRRRRR